MHRIDEPERNFNEKGQQEQRRCHFIIGKIDAVVVERRHADEDPIGYISLVVCLLTKSFWTPVIVFSVTFFPRHLALSKSIKSKAETETEADETELVTPTLSRAFESQLSIASPPPSNRFERLINVWLNNRIR